MSPRSGGKRDICRSFSRLRCCYRRRRRRYLSSIYAVREGVQSLRVFLVDGSNIKSDGEPYFSSFKNTIGPAV